MKADKLLSSIGLSTNVAIFILLLVIIYYLYLINNNLSMEAFSISSQRYRELRSVGTGRESLRTQYRASPHISRPPGRTPGTNVAKVVR